MHSYSPFWLAYAAGLVALSPIFADRDRDASAVHPAEDLSMSRWLALPDAERNRIVEQYAAARPRVKLINTERRQQAA